MDISLNFMLNVSVMLLNTTPYATTNFAPMLLSNISTESQSHHIFTCMRGLTALFGLCYIKYNIFCCVLLETERKHTMADYSHGHAVFIEK